MDLQNISPDTVRLWVESGKAVLVTGPARTGKSRLIAAALPSAVLVDSWKTTLQDIRTKIRETQFRNLVIDEAGNFSRPVLEQLIGIANAAELGYVLIDQAEEGERYNKLRAIMADGSNFIWIKVRAFNGELARVSWTEVQKSELFSG